MITDIPKIIWIFMTMFKKITTLTMCFLLAISPIQAFSRSNTLVLPENTRIYLTIDQLVSGKRGDAEAGDIVKCSVWRDVLINGKVLVKSGTSANCKVESVKHANIAGIKGKLVVAALDTKAIDGSIVQLSGGYNKEGKSRMALTISLAAIIFVPLIFITGSAAILNQGTVIDAYSGPDIQVADQGNSTNIPVINLNGVSETFTAEVILDDFYKPNAKPENFKIQIIKSGTIPGSLVIDNVNGNKVAPMPLQITESKSIDGEAEILATISIKQLSEKFQKGINRFEVSYIEKGNRFSTEVILNIQF